VYICQIAGGSIGVALNTVVVVSASSMTAGIHTAFLLDGALAVCSARWLRYCSSAVRLTRSAFGPCDIITRPTPDDSLRGRIEIVIGGVGALYLRVLLGRIAVGW
jgi:hypothetical protein